MNIEHQSFRTGSVQKTIRQQTEHTSHSHTLSMHIQSWESTTGEFLHLVLVSTSMPVVPICYSPPNELGAVFFTAYAMLVTNVPAHL